MQSDLKRFRISGQPMNLVLSFPLKLDHGARDLVDRSMQPFNTEVAQEARGIHGSPEQQLHLEPMLGRPCSSYTRRLNIGQSFGWDHAFSPMLLLTVMCAMTEFTSWSSATNEKQKLLLLEWIIKSIKTMTYDMLWIWIENCRKFNMAAFIDQNHVTKHFKMMMFFDCCVRMHVYSS